MLQFVADSSQAAMQLRYVYWTKRFRVQAGSPNHFRFCLRAAADHYASL